MKNFPKLDKFVLSLLVMIGVARLWPHPAMYEGLIDLGLLSDIGITLIFFFYGLKLNPRKLRQDLGNWRLHFLVQGSTFILFPFLVFPFFHFFEGGEYYLLALGFFFLASLPSTVSSSVVMVSIAKGNIPGAIFNASISSLLGIFITPLWMGWVIAAGTIELGSFSGILLKLLLQVFVPVLLGLLLNRFWGHWAYKNARFLKLFDQSIILLVVYLSFAESFVLGLFHNSSWLDLFWVAVGSLLLFGIAYIIIGFLAKKMAFSQEDIITATFAGSKKSLVHGTVMAGIIFADFAGVGIILLPIMVYHALQLVLVSWIAQRKVAMISSNKKTPDIS